MEENAKGWAAATRKIYSSVMVFGIGSVAAVGLSLLFEFTFIFLSAAGVKYDMPTYMGVSDITDYFWCGFMFVALIGYLFHRFYLREAEYYVSANDRKGFNAVRAGALIFVVGLLPTIIPSNIILVHTCLRVTGCCLQ